MKNLFELVKNLIKVGVLGGVVFFILKKYLPMLFGMPESGIGATVDRGRRGGQFSGAHAPPERSASLRRWIICISATSTIRIT